MKKNWSSNSSTEEKSSGWDNSTVFDNVGILETPDLSAFLVLQMKTLAKIAAQLGDEDNSLLWNRRSKELCDKLFDHFWTDSGFVVRRCGTGECINTQTSLLVMMPLVLGEEFPEEKLEQVVNKLVKKYLTPHGLATEMPESPKYTLDGYWRGPIWAPVTYLLADGLLIEQEKESLPKR